MQEQIIKAVNDQDHPILKLTENEQVLTNKSDQKQWDSCYPYKEKMKRSEYEELKTEFNVLQ